MRRIELLEVIVNKTATPDWNMNVLPDWAHVTKKMSGASIEFQFEWMNKDYVRGAGADA